MNVWHAATDGSSLGNPGASAWAWALAKDDSLEVVDWAAGGLGHGTSNVAELTALVRLLEFVPSDQPLRARLDSQYTLNSATKWRHGWKRNNWRKADGKPVANLPLMQRIDELLSARDNVELVWVKAHQSKKVRDPLNHFVDLAARQAATEQRPAGTVL